MRLCRFGDGRLGLVEGAVVRDVTAALDVLPQVHYPLPGFDLFIANLPQVMARVNALRGSASTVPLDSVTLLSPVANPGKLVAAPVNYQKHLDEVRADSNLHHNKHNRLSNNNKILWHQHQAEVQVLVLAHYNLVQVQVHNNRLEVQHNQITHKRLLLPSQKIKHQVVEFQLHKPWQCFKLYQKPLRN